MWYLLHAQEDDSLCIVHEKNLMKAGSQINLNEVSKFFYNGKEYTGPVLFKSEDHAEVVVALNQKKKEMRQKKQSVDQLPGEDMQTSNKRRSQPPNFYGKESTSEPLTKKKPLEKPKMSEEEKVRLRILSLNKKEAAKYSNIKLMESIKSKKGNQQSDDSDYTPDYDGDSVSSGNSDVDTSNNVTKKDARSDLLKGLKGLSRSSPKKSCDKVPTQQSANNSHKDSSQKDLLAEIEVLKRKLQAAEKAAENKSSGSSRENNEGSIREKNEGSSREKKEGSRRENNEGLSREKNEGSSRDKNEGSSRDNDEGSNDLGEETGDDFELNNDRDTGANSTLENDRGNTSTIENSVPLTDDSELDSFNLDEYSTEGLSGQLYGQREDTKLLTKKIYCKISVLTAALASATNVNSLVRKLMHGVFIPSKILNCTISGQSWKAGGEAAAAEKKTPLHPVALQAIVSFANAVANSKGWGGSAKKLSKLKPVLARRLIEIKTQSRLGKLKD